MPRGGRALELLVARLEAATSAGEAEVRSPEYFTGRNSQSRREVDVTVRSKVGSTTVLVMFECRDRAKSEDASWIDQIAGKRDDVGADVAVAVSARGGFTRGAQNAAARLGIHLRTLESVTVEDVVAWCRLNHLGVRKVHIDDQDLGLHYFTDTPPMSPPAYVDEDGEVQIPLDAPAFALWDANNSPPPQDPEWLTGRQVHDLAMNLALQRDGLPDLTDWRPVRVSMSTPDTPTVAVMTDQGLYPLAGVYALGRVRVEETQVPITVDSVTDDNGETTQVVHAVTEHGGQECTVSFIRTQGGGTSVLMDTRSLDSKSDA